MAHHNQLKRCPTQLAGGLPVHPVPENPVIVVEEFVPSNVLTLPTYVTNLFSRHVGG